MGPAAKIPGRRRATLQDFLAIPEDQRFHEIIDGALIEKAMPSPKHGTGQAKLAAVLDPFHRKGGGPPERPGGWRFMTEPEILFGEEPLRPDVAGWRRERLPTVPEGALITVLPDWICEILSTSNASNDTVKKQRIYHRYRIPHYWILDPQQGTLEVLRWGPDGYIAVLVAERRERVRPEPFAAIEFLVGVLFGDDEDEPPSEP
jgi:Uma2 family endonuclease